MFQSKQPAKQLTWIYPSDNSAIVKKLEEALHLHPVMAQVLVSRGFKEIEEVQNYLYAKLPDLIDPFLLPNMDKGCNRLIKALESNERIMIYGDNDVDGMTGTALLLEFLSDVGGNGLFFIPGREAIGKRALSDALAEAIAKNCQLIITVDCGITAIAEIQDIVTHGIDVIVTDHHEPADTLPNCTCLNPKLKESTYTNRELTGVGCAFKLAHAVTMHLVSQGKINRHDIDLKKYLDLVALGTIADMGILQGENRILVRYGLKQLHAAKRMGLFTLAEVASLKIEEAKATDLASKIAPRLNSLGRIDEPKKGVQLLTINDFQKAELMAKELDVNNQERQKIEQSISRSIESLYQKEPALFEDKAIVIGSDEWHPGVIPILTARLSKHYNRPTCVIAIQGEVGKGSIRTIPEFPLLQVLKDCKDLLLDWGGHDYAAGMTIHVNQIEAFKRRFTEAARYVLKEQDVLSKLSCDAKAELADLNSNLMQSLELLEPHGNGNPTPILYTDCKQLHRARVVGGQHLKLYVTQDGQNFEGIAFNLADRLPELDQDNLSLRIAYTPYTNSHSYKQSIQLVIKDFKVLSV